MEAGHPQHETGGTGFRRPFHHPLARNPCESVSPLRGTTAAIAVGTGSAGPPLDRENREHFGSPRVISFPACISPTVTAETKRRSAGTASIHFSTAPWGLGHRNSDTTFVSSGNTDLIQCGRGPMTMAVTFRGERVAPRFRREQEILQGRPRHSFQPPPLLDGDEHGRLHTAPGHDLGSVPEAGFEELAEMRSRPVGLPDPVHAFSKIEPPAGYKAGWLWMIGSGIRLSNTWRHSARRRQA